MIKSPSKYWRKKENKYRLVGSKDSKGDVSYPPEKIDKKNLEIINNFEELPQKATLVTWSIVRVAPEGFENQTPYAVGILELENGQRLTGQIIDVDYNSLKKGDTLFATFRKIYEDGDKGVIEYGLKWSM